MRHGSLLNYLRRHEATLEGNVGMLLDMCIQVRVMLAHYSCHEVIIYFNMDSNNVPSVFKSVVVSKTWYLLSEVSLM
jgi:hypothetical protein